MAIRKVLRYPDPFLRKPTVKVDFNDPDWDLLSVGTFLDITIKDSFDTLYGFDRGAALAANQIGLSQRLFVLNDRVEKKPPEDLPLVIVNPEIISKSEETTIETEGCLSFPKFYMPVERSRVISVRFQDSCGAESTVELQDWFARVFQHEIDHLDGKLFVDALPKEQRIKIAMKIGKR